MTYYIYNRDKQLLFVTPEYDNMVEYIKVSGHYYILNIQELLDCLNTVKAFRGSFYVATFHMYKSKEYQHAINHNEFSKTA